MDKELVFFKINEDGEYEAPELPENMKRVIEISSHPFAKGMKKITIVVEIDSSLMYENEFK